MASKRKRESNSSSESETDKETDIKINWIQRWFNRAIEDNHIATRVCSRIDGDECDCLRNSVLRSLDGIARLLDEIGWSRCIYIGLCSDVMRRMHRLGKSSHRLKWSQMSLRSSGWSDDMIQTEKAAIEFFRLRAQDVGLTLANVAPGGEHISRTERSYQYLYVWHDDRRRHPEGSCPDCRASSYDR